MRRVFLIFLALLISLNAAFAVDFDNTNLRKKISQMLIVGFNGTKLTKDSVLYDDIVNERISGVIIFSNNPNDPKDVKNVQNPKQLKKLISDINALSKVKLFISIDQEGGNISRLPSSRGFKVKTPTHKELGDSQDEMNTYLASKKIAQTLSELGFNMNFAPCVDLSLNPNSTIIAKLGRSFSDNPQTVIKHANAYILAHNQYNIMTVLKHFPGHGSAASHTHKGFADSSELWQDVELEPYQALISSGLAQNIMVSHIYNKKFDDKYPASLSSKTVNDLLKKKLGFSGLIITDDLQMGAIADNFTFEEAVVSAINAGCDIIILGNNLSYDKSLAQKFNDVVFNAVKDGKISPKRIDEAYLKIMKRKQNL